MALWPALGAVPALMSSSTFPGQSRWQALSAPACREHPAPESACCHFPSVSPVDFLHLAPVCLWALPVLGSLRGFGWWSLPGPGAVRGGPRFCLYLLLFWALASYYSPGSCFTPRDYWSQRGAISGVPVGCPVGVC